MNHWLFIVLCILCEADVLPRSPPQKPPKPLDPFVTSLAVGIGLSFTAAKLVKSDEQDDEYDPKKPQGTFVHIRVQKRGTRRYITTIQGLAQDLDLIKIKRFITKRYHIGGTVKHDEEFGSILQFSGDCRHVVGNFLAEHNICLKELIKVHGV